MYLSILNIYYMLRMISEQKKTSFETYYETKKHHHINKPIGDVFLSHI